MASGAMRIAGSIQHGEDAIEYAYDVTTSTCTPARSEAGA